MKVKAAACLLFLLNTLLFATYYAVSKEALRRIEPIVFSFFEMVILAPVALCILAWTWRDVTRTVIKRGVLLGSWLCLAFFTIAIALKYTTATDTAFFPSLNGLLAALIAWLLLKQPVKKMTWFAGLISVIGTVLLISYSPMGGWRGTVIAFLGGVFFTCYVFLADHEQQDDVPPWPLFGVEMLTTAAWATLIALLFGNWQAVHPLYPKDTLIILYIAGATTFLPILITVLMQKYVSPVTVSFIYILEPVLGAIIAYLYLHEELPVQGYVGGGMVIVGTIIHTWGVSRGTSKVQPTRSVLATMSQKLVPSSLMGILALLIVLNIELVLLYRFAGFPPSEWLLLYRLLPNLFYLLHQAYGTMLLFLCLRAFCWLLIWLTLVMLDVLTVYAGIASIFSHPQQFSSSRQDYLSPRKGYRDGSLLQARQSNMREQAKMPAIMPLSKPVLERRREKSVGW